MKAKVSRTTGLGEAVSEADSLAKAEFTATIDRSIEAVFKMDDEFLIWGPASVEVVDKEDDRVSAKALESALPQLLKRARLSYQHTDQIIGRILKEFETDGEVEVTVDGVTYKRETFPTDVLELDDQPPSLFVAGEVYEDSDQSQDVRRKIEEGEINSYSISGEALATQKQVEDGRVFDDILEMDLSAITVCEEGMNQAAKFAKVSGESVDVSSITPASDADEVAKADPEWSVSDGQIAEPDAAKQSLVKAMSDSENESGEDPETKSGGVDTVDGDIATKSFVDEQLSEELEKAEGEILDKAEQRAANEVEKILPGGNLATVGAVESIVDARMKGDGEHDYEDEDEMSGEDHEDEMEGEDHDEMEGEDHDYEDEDGGAEMEGEEDEMMSRAELKDQLPGDVWDVVSDYVGDSKAEKDESTDDVEKSTAQQVADLLEEGTSGQPGIDLGDRTEQNVTKEDGDNVEKGEDVDIEMGESPALANFDY